MNDIDNKKINETLDDTKAFNKLLSRNVTERYCGKSER